MPINKTSLNGFVNCALSLNKFGIKSIILLSGGLSYSNDQLEFHNLDKNLFSLVFKILFIFKSILHKLPTYTNRFLLSYVWELDFLLKIHIVHAYLNRTKPLAIILYGDRHLDFEPPIIKVASELNIKTFILQIVDFARTEVLLMSSRKSGKTIEDYNVNKNFKILKDFLIKLDLIQKLKT